MEREERRIGRWGREGGRKGRRGTGEEGGGGGATPSGSCPPALTAPSSPEEAGWGLGRGREGGWGLDVSELQLRLHEAFSSALLCKSSTTALSLLARLKQGKSASLASSARRTTSIARWTTSTTRWTTWTTCTRSISLWSVGRSFLCCPAQRQPQGRAAGGLPPSEHG